MNRITLEFLIGTNQYVCDLTGEPSTIISLNNLMSAIGIQDNNYYDNDEQVACAILRSLVIGHGFEQGNKRTAFATIKYMLEPDCSDEILQNTILTLALPGGARLDVSTLEAILYN